MSNKRKAAREREERLQLDRFQVIAQNYATLLEEKEDLLRKLAVVDARLVEEGRSLISTKRTYHFAVAATQDAVDDARLQDRQ